MLSIHRSFMAVAAAATLLLLCPGSASAQVTHYVDDNAKGDQSAGDPAISDPLEDGTKAHPFDAIQEAVDVCSSGDTVMILDGTYTGLGNRDINLKGLAITVRSQNGVDHCTIDCQRLGRAFLIQTNETRNCILSGITITRGKHLGGGGVADHVGYGVRIKNASPTITGCSFIGNDADVAEEGSALGGGIGAIGGNPLIQYCLFEENHALKGAGVYLEGGQGEAADCTFMSNYSVDGGGGIYAIDGEATVRRCLITDNEVGGIDGGSVGGTGIAFVGGTPVLEQSTLTANRGDFCPDCAAVLCSGIGTIRNCDIRSNSSIEGNGGGIIIRDDTQVTNCRISGNTARVGGGVSHFAGTLRMVGCLVSDNGTDTGSLQDGIGIDFRDTLRLINCTVTNNVRNVGNNMKAALDIQGHAGAALTVVNSIIWSAADGTPGLAGATITFSDIKGGASGEGNLDVDPLFVDVAENDFALQPGSPCLDVGSNTVAGLPSTDLNGNTRIQGGQIDMGCYEGGAVASCNFACLLQSLCGANAVGTLMATLVPLLVVRIRRRRHPQRSRVAAMGD